jgi:hypothetical protein
LSLVGKRRNVPGLRNKDKEFHPRLGLKEYYLKSSLGIGNIGRRTGFMEKIFLFW